MNRRIAALRVLVERKLAKEFQQATKGMKAEQVSLHLKSVMAAALMNPDFILASMTKSRALALQTGTNRVALRPVLLSLPCSGKDERESIHRLVQALTWQVAALIDGPVMPDSSSVLRALIAEWLKVSALSRGFGPESSSTNRRGISPKDRAVPRSPKRRKKSRASAAARPRRRKPYEWTANADRALPHPDFPDVSAVPVDWRPGRKGRPPIGATRGKNGRWIIPKGFRVISGKIHPPLALFRSAASVREILRKAGKKKRKQRTKKAVQEPMEPSMAAGEAVSFQQSTPDPAGSPSGEVPSEQQQPQDDAGETRSGEPPSDQEDGGHPTGPPAQC